MSLATTRVRRPATALWRRSMRSVVVLSNDQLHTLGGGASALWELLDGPRSPAQLIDELETWPDVSREELEHDVKRTLDQLVTIGILEQC